MQSSPEVKIGCVANLFSRMMRFEKTGDTEIGHTHQFDHLTLLAKGKLKVTVEGVSTEFIAPHMIYIHKDKVHQLEALTDETVAYCIHALRDKDTGEILDPSMIPAGVNPLTLSAAICTFA
jgi:quercetin dioxygenase-like cupin family protein